MSADRPDKPNPDSRQDEQPARHNRDHNRDEELLDSAIPIDESDLAEDDDQSKPQRRRSSREQPTQIELDDDDSDPGTSQAASGGARSSKIRAFDNAEHHQEHQWKRQPNSTGQGAVRVKTFVAKLRLDAIEHMDEQINEWLDNHPEYEVKFATTSIGPLVGKLTEDAIFVNVWV